MEAYAVRLEEHCAKITQQLAEAREEIKDLASRNVFLTKQADTAEQNAREFAEFISAEMGVSFVEKYRAVCRSCGDERNLSLLNHFLEQDHKKDCQWLKAKAYLTQHKEE